MNVKRAAAAVALTGALVAGTAACSTERDDDCRTQYVYLYVVGGVYHYGSPTGTVIPKQYVDPKKGTLKPGVTVDKGKVSMTKPGSNTGSGSKQKPGTSNTGGTVKQPPAKAPAPAPAPAPRRR